MTALGLGIEGRALGNGAPGLALADLATAGKTIFSGDGTRASPLDRCQHFSRYRCTEVSLQDEYNHYVIHQ